MTIELKLYRGLQIECQKVANNLDNIAPNQVYGPNGYYKPTVGARFQVGTLNTNIVARIIEEDEKGGSFMTLSGSIYDWNIVEEGEYVKTEVLEIPYGVQMLIEKFEKSQRL